MRKGFGPPLQNADMRPRCNIPPRGLGAATMDKLSAAASVPGVDTIFEAIRYVIGADMTFDGDLKLIIPKPTAYEHDIALQDLERLRGAQMEGLVDFTQTIQARMERSGTSDPSVKSDASAIRKN